LKLSSALKNRLYLLTTAVLFSTGGAAVKACSLASWQVAGFRSGIAALVLYLLMPGARRGWTWRTWLIGLAYAATMILFVLANKLTTSANAIFLQSTAPIYMLLLGPLALREAIRKIDIAVISAVTAGAILLLLGSEQVASTAPNPALGNWLALAAGATWAVTMTGFRWIAKHADENNSAGATVIAGNLMAFALCLPMALSFDSISPADLTVLVYLGVFQIALAYVLLTRSLRQVPGLEAATVLLVEPVLNPVWSWVIHGERPSALAIAGGVLIITVAFAGSVWRVKFTEISQLQDMTVSD
jgi:drug/metabolite transporter (DMT)-like permease